MSLTHLRLERFEPEGFEVARRPAGPSQEERSLDAELEKAVRDAGYAAGFQDGVAKTSDAYAASDRKLDAALLASLDELHTRALAQGEMALSLLRPALHHLTDTVLPSHIAETFGARVVERVERLLEAARPGPITLAVAPAEHERMEAALRDADLEIELVADAGLEPLQARFQQANSTHLLDPQSLLDGFAEALMHIEPTSQQPNQEQP